MYSRLHTGVTGMLQYRPSSDRGVGGGRPGVEGGGGAVWPLSRIELVCSFNGPLLKAITARGTFVYTDARCDITLEHISSHTHSIYVQQSSHSGTRVIFTCITRY